MPASLRQLIPPAFMLVLMLSILLALMLPGGWNLTALGIPTLYLVTLFGAGFRLMGRLGWKVGLLFPLAAATMHTAYAAGFAWGVGAYGTSSVPSTPAIKKGKSSQPN